MYKVNFYIFLILGLLGKVELSSTNVEHSGDASLFGVNLQLIPSALGESKLETKRQAIRNGNLYASNIRLSLEQSKAIGWLKTESLRKFCTATVISDRAILTAKHCFYGSEDKVPPRNSNFSFAILDDRGTEAQRQADIGEPLIAEDEFPFSFEDVIPLGNLDIAMIRFPGRPFDRPGLQPLPINVYPLEGSFKQNLIGAPVDVAGFGDSYHDNEDGRYFASVKLELVTPTYIVTNGQNEQGICGGDSGGPLLATGVNGEIAILAVVTNGDKCCVGLDQLTRVDLVAEELINRGNAYSDRASVDYEACRGLSRDFQCRGNTLHLCIDGEAVSVPCASGQVCEFDALDQRFDCVPNSEKACPNISPEGMCIDNNTALLRCEYGEERRINCKGGSRCGVIAGGERYGCISGEAALQICDPDNQSRLEWASEVAFEASNNCSSHRSFLSFPLLFLAFLILLVKRCESKSS